ncbi:HIRA-interacting protein 5 [Hypoxylon argillaceum]|nr:HIRA-interacting protein 5 [Hypoxylon argillaceum]
MTSARLLRPAAALLSATTRQLRPERCSRLHEVVATRHAHTSTILRPTLPTSWSPSRAPSATPRGARSMFIQTEPTPNPEAMKFLPNHRVIPAEAGIQFIEYTNARSTIAPPYPSPLAAQLMNTDGVIAVFYGADFITVTKAPDANWAHIRPEIYSLITEAISSGQQLVTIKDGGAASAAAAGEGEGGQGRDSLAYDESDDEVVGMIKELLETRIRPAIQEDGGDIEFRGFEDGYVKLMLRGACRTCDSSTFTLKNGIEGMLMHYIEEVKGVHQVIDQEEEIALKEFAKFEEKLREQKGPDAAPTTPGKGSLDSVPG